MMIVPDSPLGFVSALSLASTQASLNVVYLACGLGFIQYSISAAGAQRPHLAVLLS
jgi:hypothetical protein